MSSHLKPFLLPIYVQDLAKEVVKSPPATFRSHYFHGDHRVLQFVDDVVDCDIDVANTHSFIDYE